MTALSSHQQSRIWGLEVAGATRERPPARPTTSMKGIEMAKSTNRRRAGILPLEDFPEAHRNAILEAVAQPKPPRRWIELAGGLARIDSRAWYEWHWARGLGVKRANLPPGIRAAVIRRDGYVCGLCSEPVDPADVHIDHVLPVSLGGSDDLHNLQVTHSKCNLAKGARV